MDPARQIILATNIAETSVTISGIKYVIDTGMHKERVYNARSGLDTLGVLPVSMAQVRHQQHVAARPGPGLPHEPSRQRCCMMPALLCLQVCTEACKHMCSQHACGSLHACSY